MRDINPSDRRVTLRLTEKEFQIVLDASRVTGMRLSDYIRHAALTAAFGIAVAKKAKHDDPEKYEELVAATKKLESKLSEEMGL